MKNSTIFKILLITAVLLAILLLWRVNARADDGVNIFTFSPINLQGDTIYLMSRKDFGIGLGWTVATLYNNVIEIRAESVFPIVGDGSSTTLIGAGFGLNIPKLIESLGGTWLMPTITSSIGILGLYDFNAVSETDEIEPAIYLTILKVTF
jgi:hypothetical protein